MRNLRSVPATQQRAVGYVRVSMEREEMISPELQQAAIEHYCQQRDYRLVDTIVELDVSGRTFARAGVQQAIERIEQGDADVIVVWKVSRFGRTRRDWYIHADRVEVAGGALESATEAFDPLTSTGRLTRGMLVELAAWESDVKSEQWKEAQAYRIERGLPHTASPRYGYTYNPESKIHEPDPITGPTVAEAYRRVVSGQSFRAVATWLNDSGVQSPKGEAWSRQTITRILDSGFAAGLIRVADSHRPGAHEPLIDRKTWRRYQATRNGARRPPRAVGSPNPLSGLVSCVCGSNLHRATYPQLRCATGCRKTYATEHAVHHAVRGWLKDEVAADLDAATATKMRQASARAVAASDRAVLAKQVRENAHALTRAYEGWSRGIVPTSAYEATRDSLEAERGLLEARLSELNAAVGDLRVNAPRLARAILKDWQTLADQDPSGLRNVLSRLIRTVVVKPGHARSTPGKITVVPRWSST